MNTFTPLRPALAQADLLEPHGRGGFDDGCSRVNHAIESYPVTLAQMGDALLAVSASSNTAAMQKLDACWQALMSKGVQIVDLCAADDRLLKSASGTVPELFTGSDTLARLCLNRDTLLEHWRKSGEYPIGSLMQEFANLHIEMQALCMRYRLDAEEGAKALSDLLNEDIRVMARRRRRDAGESLARQNRVNSPCFEQSA